MSKDPTFDRVLKGVRKGAPAGTKATAAEIKEAKRLMDRDKKTADKRNYGRRDDDVIDTGMFGS